MRLSLENFFLTALLFAMGLHVSLAQEVRPIATYSSSNGFNNLCYHSDSVMLINTPFGSLFLNSERKWQSFGGTGIGFTSPQSKLYHITKEGRWFSDIEPSKQIFNDFGDNNIYLNRKVDYFRVIDDRFFLLKYENDTLIFKIDFFNNYTVKQNILLRLEWTENSAKIHALNDSVFYVVTSKNIYKKNCNNGNLVKTPNTIIDNSFSFYCKDSNVVVANNLTIYYSSNYAKSFKKLYSTAQQAIDPNSIQIIKNNIFFNEGVFNSKRNFTLNRLDFSGKKTSILNHGTLISKLSNTYANLSCDHIDTFPEYQWLDSITCLAKTLEGDIYKLNLLTKNIDYLGGSYNLGVRYVKASNNAQYVFHETGNNLWSFSIDTGKSWSIPTMLFQSSVKKAEFDNQSIYILSASRLGVYHFDTKRLDTTFYQIPLIIDDFFIKDDKNLVLISKKQVFEYNILSEQLKPITPITPFDQIGYLKTSSRLLALTNVGIFYSDDYGKTWPQANLSGFENFQSLKTDHGFLINESLENTIYLNVRFNNHAAIMRSTNNGQSFEVVHDIITERSRAMDVYEHQLYMIDTFGQFSEFNFDFKTFKNTLIWSNCILSGMQTTEKGMLMWNDRAEFFMKNFIKKISDSETLVCFPNPLTANQILKIRFNASSNLELSRIDLIDLKGKTLEPLNFDYLETEQVYQIKIRNAMTSQICVLKLTTKDQRVFFRKLLIN